MKNYFLAALTIASVITLNQACKAKKSTTAQAPKPVPGKVLSACDSMNVTYAGQVKTIIDQHCGNSCHSAEHKANGIDLSNYEAVKYEAGKSRFMGSMKHMDDYSPMPKKHAKLADSTLKVLSCWIETGMK